MKQINEILKVLIFTFVPAFIIYLAQSNNILDLLQEKEIIGKKVNL